MIKKGDKSIMDGGLSNSDVELLARAGGGGNGFEGGMGYFWIFALLLLAGGGFGGYGQANAGYVTQADLSASLNAQTTQNQLQSLAVETANNNYETAQLINAQTNQMLQQNNTNLINAIQGFNTVNQNITSQTNQLAQQIQQLGYQMDQCCCSIKTQMLQDRLDSTQSQLVTAQGIISNANQSQYLLGQLGRFVAWDSSGSPTTTTGS